MNKKMVINRKIGLISRKLFRPYEGIIGGGTPPEPPTPTAEPLCFTANTGGSTVKLQIQIGSPTVVSLETSTDGNSWTDYTIGDRITLSNIGDKLYFRNKSETDTGFSIDSSNHYKFVTTGSLACSGDLTTLLNKNGTDTLSDGCFYRLFDTAKITMPPRIPAKNIGNNSCNGLFQSCTNLVGVSKLYSLTLGKSCYENMFRSCTKIGLSATQDADYTQPYRIPREGTGTVGQDSMYRMFFRAGGSVEVPTINTTYYLHKDNVIV